MTVRDVAQGLAAARGGEHEVQGLGRGDEDVRRRPDEGLPVLLGGVAGADGGADRRQVVAELGGEGAQLLEGGIEVALNVVAEGLEGGDVDDLGLVEQGAGPRLA